MYAERVRKLRTKHRTIELTMQALQTTGLDVEAILERLKEVYSIGSDADLARFLGMTPSGVSTWKRRGTIDLSFVVEKCLTTPTADQKMLNLHWLITGNGTDSLDTVQSIVVEEITRRTPEIMKEIASIIIDRLKAEGTIASKDETRNLH